VRLVSLPAIEDVWYLALSSDPTAVFLSAVEDVWLLALILISRPAVADD
jgi:hypothetical protein